MSNYGNPPSDPYGQNPQDPTGSGSQPQDPYAQPTQNPYGDGSQAGYGQNPYGDQSGQEGYGVPQGVQFAHWGKRVGAYLVDGLLTALTLIPLFIGLSMTASSAETEIDPVTGATVVTDMGEGSGLGFALMVLSLLLYIAFYIWNVCIKQGKTGYTIGKGVLGIKLVKADSGQPVGAGMSFVRQIAHVVDSIPCNIGYLWPLWDDKRQTFADKIMSTYVIDQPKV